MESRIQVKDTTCKFKISSWKDFFKNLAIMGIQVAKADPAGIAQSFVNTAATIGLAKTNEDKAFHLLTNTMIRAVSQLLLDSGCLKFETFEFNSAQENLFKEQDFYIDSAFFNNPKESSIVGEIQTILRGWLPSAGFSDADVTIIINRFPSYFVFALNDEWRSGRSSYESLSNYFETPFSSAEEMELNWSRYRAWLDKSINEGILGEKFGLADIYVPLCAYYEKGTDKADTITEIAGEKETSCKTVVDLEKQILSWMQKASKTDSFRIISGGPGSGKSSFVKIFAAKYSKDYDILLIPLHQVNLEKSINSAIGEYLSETNQFTLNPLEQKKSTLIILDGLDELTQQGKACAEAARDFVNEVQRYSDVRSNSEASIQVLITGRVLVIQSIETKFREPGQILHVLPYYLPDKEQKGFIDKQKLLVMDKRNIWWEKYGALSGLGYSGLPSKLKRKNLDEITAQPLLNFLVAMSLTRGELTLTENTNLNEIYADLIDAVYERGYEGHRLHVGARYITKGDFEQALEEIAAAAWQGSGRTTTINEIQDYCSQNEVRIPLDEFQKSAEAGVTNLLTAFYFRKTGKNQSGYETFEFTHKSFGEYLTGKRLVRQIRIMENMLKKREAIYYEGWSEEEALKRWAILCRKTPIDEDILRFLQDEIALIGRKSTEEIENWQNTLCKLISTMLKRGMPMELLNPRVNKFYEEKKQSRNAEESLLVALSACAIVTNKTSHINWPDNLTAGNWFYELQGQRKGASNRLALKCLNYLDLSFCILHMHDLYDANLRNTNLHDSEMIGASLWQANFSRANLSRANLSRANLSGANLSGAILSGAILSRAILMDANLSGANLSGANLSGANLYGANLYGVILSGAELSGVRLAGVNLTGVDLTNVDLTNVDLTNAIH